MALLLEEIFGGESFDVHGNFSQRSDHKLIVLLIFGHVFGDGFNLHRQLLDLLFTVLPHFLVGLELFIFSLQSIQLLFVPSLNLLNLLQEVCLVGFLLRTNSDRLGRGILVHC